MKLRATVRRMLCMCPAAWYIFIRGIQLCCVLLFGAVMLLIAWDGDLLGRYPFFRTAEALNETAQAVLLLVVILPVCVEDLKTRGT